jgi:CBS domain-containing protein
MLTVRDLMRANPLTLQPSDSLRAAVDVLVTSETGGAAVVTGPEVVGVVSLTDVLSFESVAALVGYRPPPDENGRGWSKADGQGQGFDGVAPRSSPNGFLGFFRSPEWEALDHHSVSEVMSRKVVAVPADASIEEAARVMDAAGVQRLVVTDRGSLVGILGAREIVHAVAAGRLAPPADPSGDGLP